MTPDSNSAMILRAAATSVTAAVVSFLTPTLPAVTLCTVMILLDAVTAITLSRRAARTLIKQGKTPTNKSKISSRRLLKTLTTLMRSYVALLLAHAVDLVILEPAGSSFSALRFVAAAICFAQLLSILENEASLNGAAWARRARRYLIDKASRHL